MRTTTKVEKENLLSVCLSVRIRAVQQLVGKTTCYTEDRGKAGWLAGLVGTFVMTREGATELRISASITVHKRELANKTERSNVAKGSFSFVSKT